MATIMNKLFLASLLAASLMSVPAAGMKASDYGPTYTGDGTYYGYTSAGNCAMRDRLPKIYAGLLPLAINTPQYGNSETCGACILITRGGPGLGANPIRPGPNGILAYVHDRCPECGFGALDLSKSGDGRWKVSWKFVECPASNELQVLFEGSNFWYRKMQFRGTRSPIVSVKANGITGKRTQDNFFIFQNGGGWSQTVNVDIVTVLGRRIRARLTGWKSDGLVTAQVLSGMGGGGAPRPRPPKRQSGGFRPKKPKKCVPRWHPCEGRFNFWGTRRCCTPGFTCHRALRWGPRRCAPRPRRRKCVPQWKVCSGYRNRWGTSRCCGGFRCQRASQRNFVGKRCEPVRRRRRRWGN